MLASTMVQGVGREYYAASTAGFLMTMLQMAVSIVHMSWNVAHLLYVPLDFEQLADVVCWQGHLL